MKFKLMQKTILGLILASGLAIGAIAATPTGVITNIVIPVVTQVGTADLFKDVIGGQPAAGNVYATAAQITAVPGYSNAGAFSTTSFSYTYTNSVTYVFGQPSGTANQVTLTTSPNPADGQRECFLSTQTTTTLTWNANTGQSISGAPTSGTANSGACMTYVASLATWYRS